MGEKEYFAKVRFFAHLHSRARPQEDRRILPRAVKLELWKMARPATVFQLSFLRGLRYVHQ